jgi:hypothetical protein
MNSRRPQSNTAFSLLLRVLLLTVMMPFGKTFAQGLILDDNYYALLPKESPPTNGLSFAPAPEVIDLSPFAPEPGDQLTTQSCVGWAVAYGAMTIQLAIMENVTDRFLIQENSLSVWHLFHRAKNADCSLGADFTTAFDAAMTEGVLRTSDYPGKNCDDVHSIQNLPPSRSTKISRVTKLIDLDSPKENKYIVIKEYIAANRKPVVIGMELDESFRELTNQNMVWKAPDSLKNPFNHAMVIVGYDDSLKAFKVLNSWGSLWGKNGMAYLKYSDFNIFCRYAFVFELVSSISQKHFPEVRKPTLSVSVDMRIPDPLGKDSVVRDQNKVFFSKVPLTPDLPFYRSSREAEWQVGQIFQLVVTNLQPNTFLYVFSSDLNGNKTLVFQQKELFGGSGQASKGIIIPAEQKVFSIQTPGQDMLIVIVSENPIEIKALQDLLNAIPTDFSQVENFFNQQLKTGVFNHRLITYDPRRMSVTVYNQAVSWIPLILRL